jgi:hypothetical protein
MKKSCSNILAMGFHLAFAVTLTGCEGVLDAFNPKRVPVEVTDSAQRVASDVSNPDHAVDGVAAQLNDAPRATRISAGGAYEGDVEGANLETPSRDRALGNQPSSNQWSGSRIRAQVLITDDGDRAFQGWYDSQRGEACAFVRDAEGTMRCLPLGADGSSVEAIELSQFVAADYTIIAGPSRIKGYGLVAQDGAVTISGFYDEQADLGCLWAGSADAVHCIPQAQRISHYVDQAHTRLLIQGTPDSSSVTPNIGEHYHSSSCTSDFYRSGESYQGTHVFARGSRNARPIAQGESFYEMGEPIDGSSLAEGIIAADTSDAGRLTAKYWITPDGGAWFSHWYDNELETECVFTQGPDPRCVPKADGVRIFYADARCSDPVAEIFPKNDCSDEVDPPRYVAVQEDPASNASVSAAYAVAGERTLTTRFQKTSAGTCEPGVAAARAHYFLLDDPVPASELAGGHVVVE